MYGFGYSIYMENLGLCTIFIMSALASIPKSVYEAAQLDGANRKQIISKIMFPMASPVIVFVFLFEIVNSFKIFRESYLYYGSDYPPEYAYTLQYYMNNSFSKLNYQILRHQLFLQQYYVRLLFLSYQN